MILITGVLSSFRSLKDRTLKLEFETQEPTPEQLSEIGAASQAFGYLAFKKDEFKTEQIHLLDELKADYEDKTKTPSKRLRDVLFVAWKHRNEGCQDFEDFYKYHMEKFINHVKSKLDE